MEKYDGQVLSGEWDDVTSEFILKRVKQIDVQSVLTEKQFTRLRSYLETHQLNESIMITLHDQIPIMIAAEQRNELDSDIAGIAQYWDETT